MGYRPLADMEVNGVYFEDENSLYLVGDESLFCYYSGLPAVSAYEENKSTIESTES